MSQSKQRGQRRQRPRCYKRRGFQTNRFYAARMHARRGVCLTRHFAKKSGFTVIRLDQIESNSGCNTQYEPRKAGARSQINRSGYPYRDKWHQLERVREVALFDLSLGLR